MSNKADKKIISSDDAHILVKDKKIKKSDIVVFCACIVIAFVIWICATNAERWEAAKNENLPNEINVSQKA